MRSSILSISISLILISFGINSLSAQTKQKRYVAKVYTLDRKRVQGILESADDKGLYLSSKRSKTPILVSAQQIKEIKLRRKGKSGTGTTIGFLSGLAIGGGAVAALHNDDRLENNLRIVGGVVFTFITTAIGGAISSRPDEVIKINGRTEDYLQSLKHLQSLTPQVN
ncbi:MAG: hypothetical protein ACO1N7_00385 [Sphingobacteriaceae bacterium]